MTQVFKNKNLSINILLVLAFFIAGFFASNITGFTIYDLNKNYNQEINKSVESRLKATPSDWIGEDRIHVYDNNVVLDIKNVELAKFTDTHSMEPFLGPTSNAIKIKPKSEDDINIGDVISYKAGEDVLIHRIIKKDSDENGTYFIVKGDNNLQADPSTIRFNQIEMFLVAVIY